jgi:polysaccharide pyruvyl transferase WcaK-like protein
MKKIGLVGFFGWGNFGDELFVEVYKQFLEPHFEIKVVHDLLKKPYFSKPIKEMIGDCDAFVIGGGDLIIPWSLSDLYWCEEFLSKPVFIHSVGVPTWGGHNREVVQKLRKFVNHENVQYVNARDPESAAWITRHLKCDKVIEFPDMVCALNLPPAIPAKTPTLGVATRFRRGGQDDYAAVYKLCQKAKDHGYRIRQIILGNRQTGKNDNMAADTFDFPGKEIVYSEDIWDQCRAIGECTVLASMKFHGSVVAAMYGVPSIVLSPTDKSRNFMGRIERTDLLSNLKDPRLADHFSPFMAPIPSLTRNALSIGARDGLEHLKASLHRI